jgi:hypothetical protein
VLLVRQVVAAKDQVAEERDDSGRGADQADAQRVVAGVAKEQERDEEERRK